MKIIFTSLLIICAFLLMLPGCTNNSKTNDSSTVSRNSEIIETTELSPNVFSLDNVTVGTKVGDMEIVSINPFNKVYDMGVPASELAPQNAQIILKGQIEISGKYEYITDNEFLADGYYISSLSESSLSKVPLLLGDTRDRWFLISNTADAKKSLKGKEGNVAIIIDDYCINNYPSEVLNSATLVKVIKEN